MKSVNVNEFNGVLEGLTKEERMNKVNEIKAWYKANGHLLEEEVVLCEEDKEFREAAAAIKGAVYGVYSNTGRRGFSGFKKEDNESEIMESNFNLGKSEWITSKYKDEKGKEVITYDNGGLVGEIVGRMSAEINYGRANENERNGRHSLVEEGFSAGSVVIRDNAGHFIRKGSLNDELSYKAKEDALVRGLVKQLEVRTMKRKERKEVAIQVMNSLVESIKLSENYGDIKEIITNSQKVLFARLQEECGTTYVADNCKYIKDGKETTMNKWFLSYFSKTLWAAVNESKWKTNRKAAYERVQAKLDKMSHLCDNMYHMADMLRSNSSAFGITPKEARIALNYAKSKDNNARFSKPVFFALCELSKAA
jgi:hypothetical protein